MQIIVVTPANLDINTISDLIPDMIEEWTGAPIPENIDELDTELMFPFILNEGLPKGFHSAKFQIHGNDNLAMDRLVIAHVGGDFLNETPLGLDVIDVSINFMIELYSIYPNLRFKIGRGYTAINGYYLIYDDCCKHTAVVDSAFKSPRFEMPFTIEE